MPLSHLQTDGYLPMRLKSNTTIIPALLTTCFVLGGCGGSSRKPINPMTGMVDITVWRVLETGDFPGDDVNIGCRLTDAHIQDYIAELQWRSALYGNNTQFSWSGSIFNIPMYYCPIQLLQTELKMNCL